MPKDKKSSRPKQLMKKSTENREKSIREKYLILYHGTNKKNLEKIIKEGIKPRGKKKSNWEKGIGKSKSDLVYLTKCYACYYASMACKKDDDAPVVIKIKVDTEKMELFPDEEYVFRTLKKVWAKYSEKNQIEFYNKINPRECNSKTRAIWKESLDYMGTVCAEYIPVSCIIGYAEGKGFEFIRNCDPSISLSNFQMMSERYIDYLESLEYKSV